MNRYPLNRAKLGSVIPDVNARALINGTASAVAYPKGKVIVNFANRFIVDGTAKAQATVPARAYIRAPLSVSAEAQATPTTKVQARMPGAYQAVASGALGTSVVPRRNIQSPIYGYCASTASSIVAKLARRSVDVESAYALATPVLRSAFRSPLVGYAYAEGQIQVAIKKYPFDRASDDVFVVPFENNVFYVR